MLKHARGAIVAASFATTFTFACAAIASAQQNSAPVFDLVEDLRIASNGATAQTSLGSPHTLTVLSDGSIVAGHFSLIRVFNPSGTLARTFGPQQPGQNWGYYRIGSVGDTVWVEDFYSGRFHLNSPSGQNIADRPLSPDATFSRDGLWNPAPPRGNIVRVSRRILCMLSGERKLILESHRTATSDPFPTDSSIYYLRDSQGLETRLLYIGRAGRSWMMHLEPAAIKPGEGPRGIVQPLVGKIDALCSPGGDRFALVSDATIWGGEPGQFRLTEVASNGTVSTRTLSLPRIPVPATFADSFAKAHAQNWRGEPTMPGQGLRRQATPEQTVAYENLVRRELFTPAFFPVIADTRLARDGSLWLKYPYDGASWVVLVDGRITMRVRVPDGIQVFEVSSDIVWALKHDPDGPIIVRYRVTR